MQDGIGTTTYTYHPAGQAGAGQVASVDGPLTNDALTYTYDALGRVETRAINGAANTVTWAFDALGRVTSEANVLGTFTYGYDGPTARVASVAYPTGQTSAYSYYSNAGDRRLQTIHHKLPDGSTLSKFDYTYSAAGDILKFFSARGAPPPRASLLACARREGRRRCGSRPGSMLCCGATCMPRRGSCWEPRSGRQM